MLPGSRVVSNRENRCLAENNQNKKPSSSELKSVFSAETCRKIQAMRALLITALGIMYVLIQEPSIRTKSIVLNPHGMPLQNGASIWRPL
jgi:hypothetical protein